MDIMVIKGFLKTPKKNEKEAREKLKIFTKPKRTTTVKEKR